MREGLDLTHAPDVRDVHNLHDAHDAHDVCKASGCDDR